MPGQEARRQDDGPRPFKGKGGSQSSPQQAGHVAHVVEVEGGHHHEPLTEGQLPPHQQGQQKNDGHKAKTAQLDHDQDHSLPEKGPRRQRVHQHQPRHAGGGGGCKEGCHQPAALPRGGGHREQQQDRAAENHRREGDGHDLSGLKPVPFLFPKSQMLSPLFTRKSIPAGKLPVCFSWLVQRLHRGE